MHHRENSDELPPFWEAKNGSYVNMLTNEKTETQPEPLRGGIFADDTGLGKTKTLTMLSLIVLDKYLRGFPFPIPTDAAIAKKVVVSGDKRKIEDTNLDKEVEEKSSCGKMTLIVCPPSVLSTWTTQLKDHTKPGSLKVYKYYGDRTKSAEELKKYDIVLTTYATLATENNRLQDSPVQEVNWWRIILDKGHMIRNSYTVQSQAVCNLKANRGGLLLELQFRIAHLIYIL